jgi:hypothetical protein
MELERFVEYIFYNPKTDRLLTAIFSNKGAAIVSKEKPEGVWVDSITPLSLVFNGEYDYVLIGGLNE